MKKSIQQLREQRQAKAAELREMVDNKSTPWDAARQAGFDAGAREVEAIDAEITREQRVLSLEAEARVPSLGRDDQRAERDARNLDGKAIFNRWLRAGDNGLSAEQVAHIRNTMSTTTNGEGGHTVATEVATSVLEALKAFGGMRQAARVIRTAGGSPMNFPTSDGTSEVGEILAENATATNQDPTFGVKSLPVYKYSSKDVAVPIELLQDSSVDIEAFVNQRIATRLARITNAHYTTGSGSSQPVGIAALPANGGATGTQAATGNATSFNYDSIINLIHSVDPAYRAMPCAFMMNDTLLREIRKLKDTTGRPIFVPGFELDGLAATPGAGRLLGYPVVINQDVAVPAATAKSMFFGAWEFYVVRDAMDLTYYRFTDSAYARKGQVGFLAMMRTGGNLIDVGGAIKFLQHSAA
jgi:HK97 family phage major capsid protein